MPLPGALLGLMKDSVSVQVDAPSAVDRWGTATLGAAVAYKARVEYRNRKVMNGAGIIVDSAVQVYFSRDIVALTVNSKLTLPSGATPRIIAIERSKGPGAWGTVLKVFC